jgi:hypothetical protein
VPLTLTIGEGTDMSEKFGVGSERKKEIVVYVNKLIKVHMSKNMGVPDTIFEISIDPYFKNDAELAIAIFVVGSTRGLMLGSQPSSDALKMNAIKLIRSDMVGFLHFLGDKDGVIHIYAHYIAEAFAKENVDPGVFDRLQKVAEDASDIVIKETSNDGERCLILCSMMAVMISAMTERADKIRELSNMLKGLIKDDSSKNP